MVTALVTVLGTSVSAWLVGTQVAYRWDEVKRRRDLDLAAVNDFYRCYGNFLETWRVWNTHKRYAAPGVAPHDVQWQCLVKASAVEGDLERLLMKLASEQRLDARQVLLLSCFREAYKALREAIRTDQGLRWASRTSQDTVEFREYRAFKSLAVYVAGLLQHSQARWVVGRRPRDVPSEQESRTAHLNITGAARVRDWLEVAERELNLPAN